ncbi:unnamed protein product [Polarella glacialis]|uniref:Uncharacterized protein n=1 Tax=Polarella glacialis TaxID=89957 RepID=A0A813DTF6_POLGL|nr:unnamed protein product [Polarella glacialis]
MVELQSVVSKLSLNQDRITGEIEKVKMSTSDAGRQHHGDPWSQGKPTANPTDANPPRITRPTMSTASTASSAGVPRDESFSNGDKSILVVGGWAKRTLTDVMKFQFRSVLSNMPDAPIIDEVWSAGNRFHILFVKFKPSESEDAVQVMWRVKAWYRTFGTKPITTGSDSSVLWMNPNQPLAKRALSTVLTRGLRLLHILREKQGVNTKFIQHGFDCKVVEGCYKSGAVMFNGKTVGEYNADTSCIVWDYVAVAESPLKMNETDFKLEVQNFELQFKRS